MTIRNSLGCPVQSDAVLWAAPPWSRAQNAAASSPTPASSRGAAVTSSAQIQVGFASCSAPAKQIGQKRVQVDTSSKSFLGSLNIPPSEDPAPGRDI